MGVAIALSAVVHKYGEVLSREPKTGLPFETAQQAAPPQGERIPILAYAQDDGFFERDRDGGSEGTEPR